MKAGRILSDTTRAAVRRYGFNRPQVRAAVRLVKRFGVQPDDVGPGMGWVFLVFGKLYVGIERDGYAHT